jgi:hypothetical protein
MVNRRGFLGGLFGLPLAAKAVEALPSLKLKPGAIVNVPATSSFPLDAIPGFEEAPLYYLLTKTRNIREVVSERFDWMDWEESVFYNYVQIVRTPFGPGYYKSLQSPQISETERTHEMEWYLIQHQKSVEFNLFHGRRQRRRSNNHMVTFAGGADFFLRGDRVRTVPRGVDLIDYIAENYEFTMKYGRGGYANGSACKYLFVAPEHCKKAHEAQLPAGGRVMVVPTQALVHKPERAYLFDMAHLRLAVMKNRGLKLLTHEPDGLYGAPGHEYLSDSGLELTAPFAHTIFILPA